MMGSWALTKRGEKVLNIVMIFIIATCILGGFYVLYDSEKRIRQHKSEFFSRCETQRPRYECEALWGQAGYTR